MKYVRAEKSSGTLSDKMEGNGLELTEATVVVMQLSPEDVKRFERSGNDLILHLRDGRKFTIANFFDRYEDGEERNEIVFEDENGVTWWGQYTDPWVDFQIAEIETVIPIAPWAWAALAPLALIGAGGLGGGNTPPRLSSMVSGVTEAGITAGGNDGFDGVAEVSGNVLDGATDSDGDTLTVTKIVTDTGTFEPGDTIQGVYGSLVMEDDGSWVYTLDNSRPATQALAEGATVDEVFTFTVEDGQGGQVEDTLTLIVTGTNDQPQLGGDDAAEVSEDGVQSATGRLEVSDPDAGDSHTWSVVGDGAAYGVLTVDADGNWTYDLDNDHPAVQGLKTGESMEDVIRVRVTDESGGWTEQDVVITINGADDTPVIDPASDLTGEVTESTENNGETLTATGELIIDDPDSEGELSLTVVPGANDYLGSLTLSPVVDGRVTWEFDVDDDLLNSLPEGEVLTQEYTITVTDAEGNTTTETVTITLTGTNDRPEPQDDVSLTTEGVAVSMDVLANDADPDTGDKARMTISKVDGQPISPGSSVVLSDGSGIVTMGADGTLTFDPAPGFTGQVTIPYTVNDGSGSDTAEATADWVVAVVGVDITDTDGPGGAQDGTLSSLDDLENTPITGAVPVGGTVVGLVITDEAGNTVTVPADSITINPDGTFSTTADVRGLDDGTLTVTLTVADSNGNETTLQDVIEKDTVTSVEIDPIVVTDGEVPVITGTGVPGENVTLTINGTPVTVTVQPDGTWSHTPSAPLPTSEITITATTEDAFGNTDTHTRHVAGVVAPDVTVEEAGLPGGSTPGAGTESTTSTLSINTSDGGVQAVIIAGTQVTEAQLQDLINNPVSIPTQYGSVTLTGYDANSGTVTYSYEIDSDTQDHSAPGNDQVSEVISIEVVDGDDDRRISNVTLNVTDDVPAIALSGSNVSLLASDADLGTDPSASFASVFDVTEGADGASVSYALAVNDPASGLVDTASGEDVVLSLENGAIVGRTATGGDVVFVASVDASGNVTLDQQRAVDQTSGNGDGDTVTLGADTVNLVATVTDGDGDSVSQTAAIGGMIGFTDDAPTVSVAAGGAAPVLTTGDDGPGSDTASFASAFTTTQDFGNDGGSVATTYALGVVAGDSGLTSGGDAIELSQSGDVITGTANGVVVFTITLDPATGAVELTQSGPVDHADAGDPAEVATLAAGLVTLTATSVATDGDGDTADDSATINIGDAFRFTDDGPVAANDTASLGADVFTPLTGNVLSNDDAGADDGATVSGVAIPGGGTTPVPPGGSTTIDGAYGTLTLNSDGSYSYERNPGTPGDVSDVFSYTMQDADGDTSAATLTISIGDSPVVLSGLGDDVGGSGLSDIVVDESALGHGSNPSSTTERASGSFTFDAPDGVALLRLTQGGNSWDLVTGGTVANMPLVITSALGNTLTITGVDLANGTVSYRYDLLDDEVHPAGADDLLESFGIELTDLDGDTGNGTLGVRITDDVPAIALSGSNVSLLASDADLGTDPSASFASVFDVTEGADGASVSYALAVNDPASGLVDTASGEDVVLSLENGAIVGRTATGGDVVFVASVDASGNVTLDQQRAVDQTSGNGDGDTVTLGADTVNLVATVTDGDGDSVSQTAAIGGMIGFTDDAPTVSVAAGGAAPVLTTGDDGPGSDTASFATAFTTTPDFGNDGGSVATTYALGVVAGDSGLTSGGDAIELSQSGDVITGTANGVVVFTITLDPATGAVELTQSGPVDHADAGDPADVATLAAGLVTLTATSVATDGDGDTADDSATINIGDAFRFTDDGPVAGNTPQTEVDEESLRGGGSATVTQNIDVDYGADDSSVAIGFANAQTALNALGLSSGGTALTYNVATVGGVETLTASAGGTSVFTVTLVQPTVGNSNTPSYTFTQTGPLDHAGGATELDLPFALVATDHDGDTADITVTVRVVDDAPEAVDQGGQTLVEGGNTVGTAQGAANLLDGDTPGADGARVHEVRYTDEAGAQQIAVVPDGGNSGSLDTQHGTLLVNSDGTWTFTSDPNSDHTASDNVSDDFEYNLIDGDGDVSNWATQPITVTDTVPSIGDPVDSTVSEANLPGGTDPNAAALTATGSLNLTPGADTFNTTLGEPAPGLTSGGTPLVYVLSNSDHTLTATAGVGGPTVFVATLTNPTVANAGYQFELVGPLDQVEDPNNPGMFLPIDVVVPVTVTDADGDTDTDSFTVSVTDDAPVDTLAAAVDEDNSVTLNISADATQAGTTATSPANGTVTINANGTVTYTPTPNFSGTDTFSVTTDSGTTMVTVTVNPVSDAPTVSPPSAIDTPEDTAVALGLAAPGIMDPDGPRTERIGPITLSGFPEGAKLLDGNGVVLATADASGEITVLISDVATVAGTTGDQTMTAAEFGALQVLPPEHEHNNFTVNMSVTSYEVDAGGSPVVSGATSTTSVAVDVQAVTDDVALTFDDTQTAADLTNVDEVAYSGTGGNKIADVTLAEDKGVNLREMLEMAYDDLDGSETRTLSIQNTTSETIMVAGSPLAAGATVTLTPVNSDPSQSTDILDDIFISGPSNFSGDLNGIVVTLSATDTDDDSPLASPATLTDSVTLNLHVTPVAGDVVADDVETNEDTAVAFLENVRVTDTGSGSEIINSVTFTVDDGWTLSTIPTSPVGGATFTVVDNGAGEHTITFTGGTEADREAVLDQFEVTPPAHSSLDKTFAVSVVTTDENSSVNGAAATDTKTTVLNVEVTVNPVAERTDADTDGQNGNDVTINQPHSYDRDGTENAWYLLGTEASAGFDLHDGWANEDTSEETFALITPHFDEGEQGGTAVGTKFKWTDGGVEHTATYGGAPVEVPMDALSTLEFMAPLDVSGRFSFTVEAKTVDVDEDAGDTTTVIEISGSATLTTADILPVASAPVLRMNGRAIGREDTEIPIVVAPASSDPNEDFNLRISDIPDGATIIYNGVVQPVVGGQVTIADFDPAVSLTITPPPESNVTMDLNLALQAQESVTINGATHTVTSPFSANSPLSIQVKGVADEVTITPEDNVAYDEAALDADTDEVQLSDLIDSIDKVDTDGSEAMTIRVTGLPEGFTLLGGAMLTGSATGTDRVWSVTEAQLATATITVPENFSGEVTFNVAGVTTENDGDSFTGDSVDLSFTVNPSPEAIVTTDIEIEEDVITPLNLTMVPQNGDGDEAISAVRIAVADASTATHTLYYNDGNGFVPLSSLTPVGGYYELTPEQAATLAMLTAEHLDGTMDAFDVEYKIVDDAYQGTQHGLSTESGWLSHTVNVTAAPVTDDVTHATVSVMGAAATTSVNGFDATLDDADTVTVHTVVTSPDHDGSEHIVRVLIENVPVGVFVDGAQPVSADTWLLVLDGADAIAIDDAGGEFLDIDFIVTTDAVGVTDEEITITALVQDRGNDATSEALVEGDVTSWTLTTTFSGGEPGEEPATVDTWEYTGASTNEDASFALSDMINAGVTSHSTNPNTLSIKITGFPADTEVAGMVRTVVGGEAIWTASVTTNAGDTPAQVQAALDNLLDSIMVTPPANANDDNAAPFEINAVLSTTVEGGLYPDEGEFDATIPVVPVTDPATLTIGVGPADADGVIKESQPDIPIRISVTNPEDDPNATVVGDALYVQLSSDEGLASGTLTDGTNTYTLQSVTGVPDVPDGDYYVIENVNIGDDLDLTFTPNTMTSGTLTVDSYVVNQETGAANIETTHETAAIEVEIDNNGVTIVANGATGNEAPNSDSSAAIEVTGLSVTLNDPDSEQIDAILLTGVPSGFLVYTGDDAGSATTSELSNNAGGGALNTWVLSGDGEALPNYIAILPPRGWSGTVAGMEIVAISGEIGLSVHRTDAFPFGNLVVNPVADGVIAGDSTSFGNENEIVPLNLNVVMYNPGDASVVGAPDEHQETATITLSGVGPNAAFYIGNTEITTGITYDAGTGNYIIEGLSQSDLDALGVRQEIANYTDNTPADGIDIGFSVTTQDGNSVSAPGTGTVTLTIQPQLPTNGDDNLLWTGDVIDGLDGEDTISLQPGDSLTGAELMAGLENIETIEMGVNGTNSITELSGQNVRFMTDGDNALTINGTADDQLSLTSEWTDNGGGNYSADITQGAITTTVTLTVAGGVVVSQLPPPQPIAPLNMSAASPLGLKMLDNLDEPKEKADESDLGSLGLGDVLSTSSDDGLGKLLPGGENAPVTPAVSDDSSVLAPADPISPWEDDLSGSVISEV